MKRGKSSTIFGKETLMDWPFLRHDGLLHEITESGMRGKPSRARRKTHVLHEMANDVGYVALKRAAEVREGWRHREWMSKTCFIADDY